MSRKALEQYQDELLDELNNGGISQSEYNRRLRESERDYAADVQDAAERAYRDEFDRW